MIGSMHFNIRNSLFLVHYFVLIFHLLRILHINGLMTAVKVYDDRNGNGCFCCCNGDDKNGKEHPIQLIGPQVLIERNEIQVHAVQYQFHTHEHGHQVPSCKETKNADEKQGCADE